MSAKDEERAREGETIYYPWTPFAGAYMAPVPPAVPASAVTLAAVNQTTQQPMNEIEVWVYNGLPAADREKAREAWPGLNEQQRQALRNVVLNAIATGQVSSQALSHPVTYHTATNPESSIFPSVGAPTQAGIGGAAVLLIAAAAYYFLVMRRK